MNNQSTFSHHLAEEFLTAALPWQLSAAASHDRCQLLRDHLSRCANGTFAQRRLSGGRQTVTEDDYCSNQTPYKYIYILIIINIWIDLFVEKG